MIDFNKNRDNMDNHVNNNPYSARILHRNGEDISLPTSSTEFTRFMTKTFALMSVALFITFITAYFSAPYMLKLLLTKGRLPFFAIIIAQIGLVMFLSYKLVKGITFSLGAILFLAYSFVTGLTLSSLMFVYDMRSIINAFAVTALFFVALCIVGHITNYKILTWGRMLMFGLIFFIIVSFISILFFPNVLMSPMFNLIGIILFAGFTMYDFQSIKYAFMVSNGRNGAALIIASALNLYLDFINLFMYILRLLANSRD